MLADRLGDLLRALTAKLGFAAMRKGIVHAEHFADSNNAGIVQMNSRFFANSPVWPKVAR